MPPTEKMPPPLLEGSSPLQGTTAPLKKTPGRLRQLAADYIRASEKELGAMGLQVRSSMELEFTVEDTFGVPAPKAVFMTKPSSKGHSLESALKDAMRPHADYIQKVAYECVEEGTHTPVVPYQYEINIADPRREGSFHPLAVAEVTEQVKSGALKKALLRSVNHTALKSARDIYDDMLRLIPPLQPNFNALPYPLKEADREPSLYTYQHKVTSGLHNNFSLYDTDNHNLFAQSRDLLEHCARSLARIQYAAGIAFLPGENSLKRIGANEASPKGIGIATERKHGPEEGYSSVNIRKAPRSDEKNGEQIRIENRLPGADVDPLVCQALTMAAILDAVREHMQKAADPSASASALSTSGGHFLVDAVAEDRRPQFSISPNRGELLQRLASDRHMRQLLGAEFQRAILREYGKDAGASLAR